MLFLAQSDTTVGFLSYSLTRINEAKQRPHDQKTLQTLSSFKELSHITRVPKKHRNLVRRAKKTSFVLANGRAFRVVAKDSLHHGLLKKMGPVYSSSANLTSKAFKEEEAVQKSDIIIKDSRGFFESSASSMFKLSKTHKKRLR